VRTLIGPDAPPARHLDPLVTRLLVLVMASVAALAISVSTGSTDVAWRDIGAVLLGGGDTMTRAIILDLRLPRALLAIVAGGGLALAGTVFQALLRNPLAEPYVLGVSNGAAVGAVSLVVLGAGSRAPAFVPAGALVGALIAILLVFRIALRVGHALDTRVLLLAGVVVGAFLNAIILLLLTFADVESFRSAIFWMMGSLAGANWTQAGLVSLYMLPAAALLIGMARSFNLVALGEDTAATLGTNVERVKFVSYIIASLLVAAAVAVCGVIGFVGLIVPHALRLAWGSDHRLLLPGSFLAGGAFLLLADTLARTVASPAELPVGVITALVGVPLFILLLRRGA
jgi:iron complex transport system permease protein